MHCPTHLAREHPGAVGWGGVPGGPWQVSSRAGGECARLDATASSLGSVNMGVWGCEWDVGLVQIP